MRDHPSATTAALTASPALALRRSLALQAAGVVGFAALAGLAAHVRIPLPFTPVPITLQTAVALLAGATLGPVAGTAALGLYLLAGAAGLPVFTSAGALAGPTAGFLFAFAPAATVAGILARRGWTGLVAGMALGSLVIYAGGVTGLCLITGLSPVAAVGTGVLPFLAGDVLKLAAALAAARLTVPAWQRLLPPR